MPNLNNEGFAIAPQAECVNGLKPVFYADDTNDELDRPAHRQAQLHAAPGRAQGRPDAHADAHAAPPRRPSRPPTTPAPKPAADTTAPQLAVALKLTQARQAPRDDHPRRARRPDDHRHHPQERPRQGPHDPHHHPPWRRRRQAHPHPHPQAQQRRAAARRSPSPSRPATPPATPPPARRPPRSSSPRAEPSLQAIEGVDQHAAVGILAEEPERFAAVFEVAPALAHVSDLAVRLGHVQVQRRVQLRDGRARTGVVQVTAGDVRRRLERDEVPTEFVRRIGLEVGQRVRDRAAGEPVVAGELVPEPRELRLRGRDVTRLRPCLRLRETFMRRGSAMCVARVPNDRGTPRGPR